MTTTMDSGFSGWKDACTVFGILRRHVDPPTHADEQYKAGWMRAMALQTEQAEMRAAAKGE